MIIVLYTFLFFNFMILSVVRSENFIIKIKENKKKEGHERSKKNKFGISKEDIEKGKLKKNNE